MALTGCSGPALQPGAEETGEKGPFLSDFPAEKRGETARRCRSGERRPCPSGLPVPPSPHALRAHPSEVAHPSSSRGALSARGRKASD